MVWFLTTKKNRHITTIKGKKNNKKKQKKQEIKRAVSTFSKCKKIEIYKTKTIITPLSPIQHPTLPSILGYCSISPKQRNWTNGSVPVHLDLLLLKVSFLGFGFFCSTNILFLLIYNKFHYEKYNVFQKMHLIVFVWYSPRCSSP